MAAIELKALPVQEDVLTGESMPIAVSVKNIGNVPVEVHRPDYGNPFVYQLLSIDSDHVRYRFSEKKYWSILNPESQEPDVPEMVQLAAGKTMKYETNLGEILTESVFPGPYRLIVSYTLGSSTYDAEAVRINISVPRVAGITSFFSRQTETLATVYSHRNSDDRVSLMQRESSPGHPGLGVTFRRTDFTADAPPTSIALAADSGDIFGGRWLAWIENNRITAAWGWGKQLMGTVGPEPTGLTAARLLEPGLRLDGRHAMFLVAGYKEEKPEIKAFAFVFVPQPVPEPGPDKSMPAPPLPSPDSAPSAPGASAKNAESLTFDLGSVLPERILVQYADGDAGKTIELVWTQMNSGICRIYRRTLDPADPAAHPVPQLLFERSGEPVALEMEPAGEAGRGVVDALFGPEGDERRMTYLRISLDPGTPLKEWTFEARHMSNAPIAEDQAAVDAEPEVESWAISPVPSDQAPVLAKTGDRLVLMEAAANTGWHLIEAGVETAEYLRLFALYAPDRYGGRLWATWIDPVAGIQYRQVR